MPQQSYGKHYCYFSVDGMHPLLQEWSRTIHRLIPFLPLLKCDKVKTRQVANAWNESERRRK